MFVCVFQKIYVFYISPQSSMLKKEVDTAMPATPVPSNDIPFSFVIPPIAITGTVVRSQIVCNNFSPICFLDGREKD